MNRMFYLSDLVLQVHGLRSAKTKKRKRDSVTEETIIIVVKVNHNYQKTLPESFEAIF